MKREIKKIFKELNIKNEIYSIDISENNFMFYQKIIKINVNVDDEKQVLTIILNAYNKKEFLKNNYYNSIKEQILDQKYLFE